MLAVILSFSLSFLAAIYAPVSLYLLNVDEFSYDVYDLLKMMLPVFGGMLALLLVFSGFVVLIGKKWKKLPSVWAGILFVGFLTAYIQGTFLAGHLPVLTGDEIDWGRYPVQRLASILLWITVISLTLFVFKKRNGKKIIAAVSGLITLMLIFSLMLTGLTTDGFRAKTDYITTFNGISELSGDKNLVVFLADAVAASKYEELLEKHPEYREGLEDFTYYGNTLGGYPYTTRSIPLIITGRWYENNGSFYSFCNEAYRDFPLLHVLQEGGYRINLYEEEILLTEENMHLFSNTAKTDGSSFMYPAGFYKAQAKLAGFRYLPFDLKPLCVITPAKIANSSQRYNKTSIQYSGNNSYFYQNICHTPITLCEKPVFSFIHIAGAHTPFIYDRYVEESRDADYTTSVEASFTIMLRYLDLLRRAGVYDNTAVVLLADHGTNERMDPASADPTGRQNPILFVKGIGEHHPYRESDAPVSFDDLQNAYLALLDGKTEKNVFSIGEDALRQRRYLSYNLYDYTLTEYLQQGEASDPDTLKPTGVVYRE